MVMGPTSSPTTRKLPVQKGTNMPEEVRWHKIYPEKFSQRDINQNSVIVRKVSPAITFFRKKGPITMFFIKAHHIWAFGESCSCSLTL
jgi:hypothetical protein